MIRLIRGPLSLCLFTFVYVLAQPADLFVTRPVYNLFINGLLMELVSRTWLWSLMHRSLDRVFLLVAALGVAPTAAPMTEPPATPAATPAPAPAPAPEVGQPAPEPRHCPPLGSVCERSSHGSL